ncbi:ABC transporter ATP-binding protein [Microbacterium sp. SLBN-146]|uniref:ABC transporter ATP-binding protein n=1 Tax=Microbacterium sp. SLBN-146 TaxID=2768457 RepID=UPI00115447D9|nr:ABC transporter ATP-binding protein [Microbacterium sp. SLBN-146]TQJ30443.1 sulfonate transport system ATP-binding protein [Microbacterium sp. SLBN-146]
MPEQIDVLTRVPAAGVQVVDVERTFTTKEGPRTVLQGLSLDVTPGEIIAVVGPSGCGKSTLLRLIGGLDSPTAGTIRLDGEEVHAHDDSTAIAFQEPRLLPWRTIAQNVALGLPHGVRGRAAKDRVSELLELVGLTHAATQRPREVSGGMAQRASLARALARSPRVLLLDEPFGALDALTRLKMHDLLLDIHRAQPTTIVLVTHDVEEALYLADHVLMLRNLQAAQTEPDRPRAKVVALGSSSGLGALGRASTHEAVPGAEGDGRRATGSIGRFVSVPSTRPRDRGARSFTDLRASLLDGLGVHKTTTKENA